MDISNMLYQLEHRLLLYITIYLVISSKYTDGAEYPLRAEPDGSFTFYKSMFNCTSEQRIGWDILVIVVHTNSETKNCNADLARHQNPSFWNNINRCLNSGLISVEGCGADEEYQYRYQVQMSLIVNSTDTNKVRFPCQQAGEQAEITDLHMIFECVATRGNDHHDEVLTEKPLLPPTMPEDLPPPPLGPTMAEHGDHHQPTTRHHVVTTEAVQTDKTTAKTKQGATEKPEPPPVTTHPLTKNELGTIVGPSVACLVVVIIAAAAVIVYFKRKHTGFPRDLQGESLFSSRRFSTASQISDVSINIQPMQTQP